MPKDHIPASLFDSPRPLEDEELIADRVEDDRSSEDDRTSENEEEIEEGGLGPRGWPLRTHVVQIHSGNTCGDVQPGLSLNADRLKCD